METDDFSMPCLRNAIDARPFVPFELILGDGRKLRVAASDRITITAGDVVTVLEDGFMLTVVNASRIGGLRFD